MRAQGTVTVEVHLIVVAAMYMFRLLESRVTLLAQPLSYFVYIHNEIPGVFICSHSGTCLYLHTPFCLYVYFLMWIELKAFLCMPGKCSVTEPHPPPQLTLYTLLLLLY